MTDVLIRDHDFGSNAVTTADGKVAAIYGSNKFFRAHASCLSPNRENIDAQLVILKKLCDGIQLILPLVEGWNGRVGCGPTMRHERALLG